MVTNNDNKFITDSKEITNSIKAIFQKAKWIRCAVAYWGKGASDTILKELKTQDIIIIANAFSGGCNPAEIEKLIENFHGKVYSDEYLHAKVYCSNLGVVIGSANASTNGLGIEGTNATSLNEAVIFSQNYEIIKNVRSWFDKIVNENKCNLIDKSDLAIIKENYERRAKGIIFKKRFLDSVLYGDYKENIYIVVAFSMPKNDPIAKGAKEVITKASRKHPNMINTKDTDWYYDIDKDKFPFGKKVFGFIRDHNGGKIEKDGNGKWVILEKNFQQKQTGSKKLYTFCNPDKTLPAHQNDICKILNKLQHEGILPQENDIVLKIDKQGLKCIFPDNSKWTGIKGGIIQYEYIRDVLCES